MTFTRFSKGFVTQKKLRTAGLNQEDSLLDSGFWRDIFSFILESSTTQLFLFHYEMLPLSFHHGKRRSIFYIDWRERLSNTEHAPTESYTSTSSSLSRVQVEASPLPLINFV